VTKIKIITKKAESEEELKRTTTFITRAALQV
jgi:hypothetical protein